MRQKLLLALVALTAATATLVAAPVASADDTQCVGTISGPHDNVVVPAGATCTLDGAMVKGNVTCDGCASVSSFDSTIGGNFQIKKTTGLGNFIEDTIIGGNLEQVESASELDFLGSSAANLKFEKNANKLSVETSTIAGNVAAHENKSSIGEMVELDDVSVGGDVLVQKNAGTGTPDDPDDAVYVIELSDIAGNLQMQENSGASFKISMNGIGANLQFFRNQGASTISGNTIGGNLQCKENNPPPVGGGNTAKQKEDQCAAL
jgi:hypothetical protein